MRRVIHIPIVHGQADLGPVEERVRRAYIEKGGEEAWRASREAVSRFWNVLEQAVDRLPFDHRKLRLYQDGLPVCGHETRIVRDLAQQGGANYRILLKLAERGAMIEGTEDPDLIRREYDLIMRGLAPAAEGSAAEPGSSETAAVFRDLLDRRDRFIAHRIDTTLQEGETGMLFLGALHRATTMLPKAIEVTSLAEVLRSGSGAAGD